MSRKSSPGRGLRASGAITLPLFILFFLSGFTCLVYEVAWVRLFTGVFGNTTYSVTAVLSAFMAGLALGSRLFGKLIDTRRRQLVVYAMLEAGIALFAVLITLTVPLLNPVYGFFYNTLNFSDTLLTAVRFALSFVLVFIPTLLMGGTLPVIARFFIRRMEQVGTGAGILYGLNTLGAAAGCLVTGFYLIRVFGVRESVFIAALINIIIAACVFLAARLIPVEKQDETVKLTSTRNDTATFSAARMRVFLALVAGAGFVSLSCEILWTRLLVFMLKTTVYAFSIMLTTFLLGIGLGSLIFALVERRFGIKNYLKFWGLLQWGVAVSVFLSLLAFGSFARMPIEPYTTGVTWAGNVLLTNLLPSIIVMALPTLLIGIAFPAAVAVFTRQISHIGESFGSLYAVSTVGSILGCVVTGFFLVALAGTQVSMLIMVFISCGIATLALVLSAGAESKPKNPADSAGPARFSVWGAFAPWPAVIAAFLILPGDYLFRYYNMGEAMHDRTSVIDYAHEGIEGITTVHHFASGHRVISTGSINVAGTAYTLRTTQKLQAHIPMLLHPVPRLICQVGFGSGETSRIVTSYDIERLDVVEISSSVIETSDRYFSDINGGVVRHPKFRPVIMDGANYFRLTGERYDVIMNDSIWPYYAGNSGLYTREYFRAAKKRLKPGGIMTSWMPVDMDLSSFTSLLKTFRAEFPYVSFWFATSHDNQHALIAGSDAPFSVNPRTFLDRFERYARRDLVEIGYSSPSAFLDIFKFDQAAIDEMEPRGRLHTENDPYLEFAVSRTTMHDLTNTLSLIRLYRKSATSLLPDGGRIERLHGDIERMGRATGHVLTAMAMNSAGNPGYTHEIKKALAIVPDYPGISTRSDGISMAPAEINPAEGPPSHDSLVSNARDLLREGAYTKMVAVLKNALEMEPSSGEALALLGEAYLKMGRFDEASDYFKKAIASGGKGLAAHYHLGWIYLRKGDLDAAAKEFMRGLRRNPDAAELHYALGMTRKFQYRITDAKRSFNRALELTPFDGEIHFELGLIHEAEGDRFAADRRYRQALRFDPAHDGARQGLARLN
ncbi:MAG TPA: fused MFS/spermidine synthase [Spirochaetota bacterium]|nr:fused MFS/spermidine synthase [Spirochaetota bacterium]